MSGSSHQRLNLQRGSLQICSSFSLYARCSDEQCLSLHVCRAWLAGNCRTLGCPLPHDLRSLHNLAALSHVYMLDMPKCDENLRSEVAATFAQLCIFYTLAQCTLPSCNRLHMCREWLRTGRCSSLCQLSHNFTTRERNILNAFQVQIPPDITLGNMSPRGIQAMLANLICADGTYVKLSTCNCFEAEPMTTGQASQKKLGKPALFHPNEDEFDDDYENDVHAALSQHTYDHFLDSYQATHNASAQSRKVRLLNAQANQQLQPQTRYRQPSAPSSSSSSFTLQKEAADQNDYYSNYEESSPLDLFDTSSCNNRWIPPPVRAAAAAAAITPEDVPASAEQYGDIRNVSSIVKYLIRCGGWAPWRQFANDFKIPLDFFELQKWLFARQHLDTSYTGARAEWIRSIDYDTLLTHTRKSFDNRVPEEVNMFRFARICVVHQCRGCRKGANCQYLHVCAVYLIGGHCEAGDRCPLGHRIDETLFAKLPFPADWSLAQKLRFVRECHPCVCRAYNSAAGCSLGERCFRLHVCNDYVRECCKGASTGCQLAHNLHSEQCKRVYKHYMLMDIAFKPDLKYLLAWLIMPFNSTSEQTAVSAAKKLSMNSSAAKPKAVKRASNASAATSARASTGAFGAASAASSAAGAPKAAPAAGGWSGVSSADAVLKFLIGRGGLTSWPEFCTHFSPSADVTFPAFEKHLRQLSTRDHSYTGRHFQYIHGLDFTSGHTSRAAPDAVDMFRFLRLCGHWQRSHGKCLSGLKCDHLHICRNWLVGECAEGEGCPMGHAFAKTVVVKMPFPLDWSLERMLRFVRNAHPRVCAEYNSAEGCAKEDCRLVHLCSAFLLERCAGECMRSHDFCFGNNVAIYKRFGIQDLPLHPGVRHLFGWLLMPVLHSSLAQTEEDDEPASEISSPATLSAPSSEAKASFAASINGSMSQLSIGLPPESAAPKSPASKKSESRSPNKSIEPEAQTAPPTASSRSKAAAGSSDDFNVGAVNGGGGGGGAGAAAVALPPPTPSKKPFICEAMLRGVCGLDEGCEYFHLVTAWDSALFPDEEASEAEGGLEREPVLLNYCWQYRVPREWTSKTGFAYVSALEADSLSADGWLTFEWSEEAALEKAFIDPSQDSIMFQIETSKDYPFVGRTEIRFESSSASSSTAETLFTMRARLKEQERDEEDPDKSNYQLTKPVELDVRCLRAPSRCALRGNCARATNWIWWLCDLRHQFEEQSVDSEWIDCSKLFGDHVQETEAAFLDGKQSYNFKAKPSSKATAVQAFKFNFEAMTLKAVDASGAEFELRRRPAAIPIATRPALT